MAKSSFTVERFALDYKECLKIMKQNKMVYPESLIVGTFLNKVLHSKLDNFCQMYDSTTCTATFGETITALMKMQTCIQLCESSYQQWFQMEWELDQPRWQQAT
jgi:hypothetical protein